MCYILTTLFNKRGSCFNPSNKRLPFNAQLTMLHGFTEEESNQLYYLLDEIETNIEKGIVAIKEATNE